jgi:hypothetical protein
MTSLRQIDANRRNALLSTGPRTEAGKRRSRRNAVRHGLTTETVIEGLEDPGDYKAFELSVTADFDAQTAIERELVLRLASLFWRLRRAVGIETGLLQIQAKIIREVRQAREIQTQHYDLAPNGFRLNNPPPDSRWNNCRDSHETSQQHGCPSDLGGNHGSPNGINAEIGHCFLRLTNLDNGAFERLSRYEMTLWRQVRQILVTIDILQRKR